MWRTLDNEVLTSGATRGGHDGGMTEVLELQGIRDNPPHKADCGHSSSGVKTLGHSVGENGERYEG